MPARPRQKHDIVFIILGGFFYGSCNRKSCLRHRRRYRNGLWCYRPGEGNAVGKALEGMARQPEMANDLRTNMILGCAITESTGIYSLVIALLLLFVF